jgi:hypothetical protein
MRRAAALFIGSYGRRDVPLSPPERSKAEEIAREIGRALVAHDIDPVVGGSFEMAGRLADGAVATCTARGLELRDRFRTFYAHGYPPPQGGRSRTTIPHLRG